MAIDVEHKRTIAELNEFIEEMKDNYNINIKVINVSSTIDGYDLFYEIVR